MSQIIEASVQAERIIKQGLEVRAGEEVIIVCDTATDMRMVYALAAAVQSAGAEYVICMTPSRRPGDKSTNVSKIIEKAYEGADVSIGITRTSGASIYNRRIWDLLKAGKIRHNSMVMRDMVNWIQGGALADYEALFAEGERLAALWRRSRTIEITTALGTQLSGQISNVVYVECGKAHKPGMQMAFSDGEVSQAPDEGTVNGTLVVDGPICYLGSHPQPVRLDIRDGRVVSCSGDPIAARRLNQIFAEVENATNIAEIGIGLNPESLFNGDFEEEKKARGTVHVAIGANVSYGGTVYSPIHMDMVIYKPTVTMDGKRIATDGAVVFETPA
ncbi:thermophilic metalloprotease (M29) [Peptococcaceae bacterium CEB3]|nr:thermophilic metalloprotease (M29) [Peptococcaceae bacterium CEB3]